MWVSRPEKRAYAVILVLMLIFGAEVVGSPTRFHAISYLSRGAVGVVQMVGFFLAHLIPPTLVLWYSARRKRVNPSSELLPWAWVTLVLGVMAAVLV